MVARIRRARARAQARALAAVTQGRERVTRAGRLRGEEEGMATESSVEVMWWSGGWAGARGKKSVWP